MGIRYERTVREADGEWEGSLVNRIHTRYSRSLQSKVHCFSPPTLPIKLGLQLSGITQPYLFISSHSLSPVRLDWLMFCQGTLAVWIHMMHTYCNTSDASEKHRLPYSQTFKNIFIYLFVSFLGSYLVKRETVFSWPCSRLEWRKWLNK